MSKTIGIIGTGAIAEAVVTGLCKKEIPPSDILLSPRNPHRAQQLAETFSQVSVAEDNQEVVSNSDLVFLAIRPQVVEEVFRPLTFHPEQTILSFIAGVSIEKLESMVAPASDIVRMIPLPAIARHEGPILLSPPSSELATLFQDLGKLVQVESEEELETFCAVTGLMAPYFGLLDQCTSWLSSKGINESQAFDFVGALFKCLDRGSSETGEKDFSKVAKEHATPQGFNEHAFREFSDIGWFADVSKVLDLLNRRLKGEASFEDTLNKGNHFST